MQLKQKTDSDGMIIRSPNKLHTNKYVRLRTRTDKLVYNIYTLNLDYEGRTTIPT